MAEKDAAARGTEIEETENVGATTGGTMEIKRTAVASVALTDALARDVTPKFSKSMLQLYGIMVLVTLSKSIVRSFSWNAPSLTFARRRYERL